MFLLQFKILYYMYHVQGYSTCWHAIIGFIYHQVQKDIQMYCNSHTCTCIKSVWTLILIGPLIHWNIRNQEHLLVISNYFYLCQNPNLIKIRTHFWYVTVLESWWNPITGHMWMTLCVHHPMKMAIVRAWKCY